MQLTSLCMLLADHMSALMLLCATSGVSSAASPGATATAAASTGAAGGQAVGGRTATAGARVNPADLAATLAAALLLLPQLASGALNHIMVPNTLATMGLCKKICDQLLKYMHYQMAGAQAMEHAAWCAALRQYDVMGLQGTSAVLATAVRG